MFNVSQIKKGPRSQDNTKNMNIETLPGFSRCPTLINKSTMLFKLLIRTNSEQSKSEIHSFSQQKKQSTKDFSFKSPFN